MVWRSYDGGMKLRMVVRFVEILASATPSPPCSPEYCEPPELRKTRRVWSDALDFSLGAGARIVDSSTLPPDAKDALKEYLSAAVLSAKAGALSETGKCLLAIEDLVPK